MLDEILAEGISPDNIDNKIMLALVVTVKTNVVIDTNLVEHVEDGQRLGVGKRTVVSAGCRTAPIAWLHAHAIAPVVFDFEQIWCFILVKSTLFGIH